MRPFNLSIQSEVSPRADIKTNYQPRLISGGLLPLLITPSLNTNIRISHKVSNSCPPTPLPSQNLSLTSKANIPAQNRPQSAFYRQKPMHSIPPNEYPCLGEEYLIGYNPSPSEFGEWADEPLELYSDRKTRQKHTELDLGLKGNPVCYSPRSSKFKSAKNRLKDETETVPDPYRFIPDAGRKYQLQEHSLHSIRPDNLLRNEARRRTMDFVLVGQKKQTKKDEENKNIQKFPGTDSRSSMKDKNDAVLGKSLKVDQTNVAQYGLKLDQDSNNKQKTAKEIKVVIPPPPSPVSKRKHLIGRTGIRKFGLSNGVKPNYVPHSKSTEWQIDKENLLRGNAILQSSNFDLTLSRPHSVIA